MDVPLGRSLAALAALAALGVAHLAGQTAGSLIGTVRDLKTGAPVVGAEMVLEGTRLTVTTDAAGRYRLFNVPPGPHVVRITGLGYATVVEQLNVSAGEMAVAHFHLPMLAVMIEQLVVTGRRPEERGAPVEVDHQTATTLADIIGQLAPGVEVIRGSGQVGAGTRIRLRGPNSLDPQPPLIFVDGMRVEYANSTLEPGPAGPSILDLLDPAMIERVEVLRGAEAASYGLGAKNGVILITTKRGPS